MRLKEDDEACREALKSGKLLLYHKLSPLLRKTSSGIYKLASLNTSGFNTIPFKLFRYINKSILHIHLYNCIPISLDLAQILEKVGKTNTLLMESFLLGCTAKGEPQFSLEVGQLIQPLLYNTMKYSLKLNNLQLKNALVYPSANAFIQRDLQ